MCPDRNALRAFNIVSDVIAELRTDFHKVPLRVGNDGSIIRTSTRPTQASNSLILVFETDEWVNPSGTRHGLTHGEALYEYLKGFCHLPLDPLEKLARVKS